MKYYKLDIGKKIFIPISRNWRKLYFLFLSQSSQIGVLFPNNLHLLAILFIFIIIFALIWLLRAIKDPNIDAENI